MKKLLLLTLLISLGFAQQGKIDMHGGKKPTAQIFYGKILEIQGVMGYKYLHIDENGKKIWVAIANAPVKVGDKIGYDKRTVLKDFRSKSLKKTFKTIIFASDVYLASQPQKPRNLREMLGLGNGKTKNPHSGMGVGLPSKQKEEKPAKPFVKKEFYSVEEVYMWRKNLQNSIVKVKGKVYKVSHQIMKRDWVHLGDGTGDEKMLTDDLVFTTKATTLKAGDSVIASGKVIVDKDFGYGYFYKAIVQDASFTKEQ